MLPLHKTADGADTRFARSRTAISEAPLETWLGVLSCGAYTKAGNDPAWPVVKLDNMWNQETDHDYDDSCNYDDDSNSNPGNDDTVTNPAS